MSDKPLSTRVLDLIQPFVIGGASGCLATCVIQPVDLLKVRIQLKSEMLGKQEHKKVHSMVVLKEIYQQGGIRSFYRGLDSALARQIFYTTSRMGIYKQLFNSFKTKNGGKDPSLIEKCVCAMTAGFIGAYIGTPADLSLVRMQADTMLPPEQRRNYKNVFDAFRKIVHDEGLLGLWRGSTPTVIRAVVLNLAMLAPYDEVKERINHWRGTKDTQSTRLISSAVAGFLASFSSLPFDNAKTKLQKMQAVNGVFPYKNIFDAMFKTVSNEGLTGLWVGFPTYYFRIAPHVVITLLLQDFLTDHIKMLRAKH